jgi:hypothetical protein
MVLQNLPGDEGEIPQDLNMQHAQALGPLQHENIMQQRLAAMQQSPMINQEGGLPPRMMPPMPGMIPSQMQPQQGKNKRWTTNIFQ